MFYEPASRPRDVLPHDPFKAIVAPRPIGWIGSVDREGRQNLAPYSFFNAVSGEPPIVAFSSYTRKDTLRNIEETGDFTCNLATWNLREAVNHSSASLHAHESEFSATGLTPAPSRNVKSPHVAEAAAVLECALIKVERLQDAAGGDTQNYLVLGEVVGIHIDERFLSDGRFDLIAAGTIMRAGYFDYVRAEQLFELIRPK